MADIADLTNLDGLMKDVYEPGIVDWVERDINLWHRMEKSSDRRDFEGRQAIIAFKDGDTQGIGSRAEYAVLPSAQRSSIGNMKVDMAHHYAIIELTRQLISQSRTNRGAFAKGIDLEVDSARESLQQDLARQTAFGDATGWIGRVSAVAGTTITFETQPTVVGQPGVRNFRKNMKVDFYDGTGGAAVETSASRKVTAVNPALNQITLDVATGVAVGNYAFREDSKAEELMGLAGIIDDGSRVAVIQNVTRATQPLMKANIMANAGALRPWSPKLMDQAAAQAKQVHGAGWPSAIYSRIELQQQAADHIRRDRKFEPRVMKLNNGYSALEWTTPGGTIPWIDEFYYRDNEIGFVHEAHLIRYVLEEIQFDKFTGTMWIENGQRRHAYEARLFTFQQVATRGCLRHTRLEDMSYTL